MFELVVIYLFLGVYIEMLCNGDYVWQIDVGIEVCFWLVDYKVFG